MVSELGVNTPVTAGKVVGRCLVLWKMRACDGRRAKNVSVITSRRGGPQPMLAFGRHRAEFELNKRMTTVLSLYCSAMMKTGADY